MCIAIPMKILAIEGDLATAFAGDLEIAVSLALVENPKVGDYIVVHAGYAIELLDPEQAQSTLDLLHEMQAEQEG
jgi:hydrogenase expression/formation protein HypC